MPSRTTPKDFTSLELEVIRDIVDEDVLSPVILDEPVSSDDLIDLLQAGAARTPGLGIA